MKSAHLLVLLPVLMGAEACHRGSRTCERSSSGATSAAVQAGARPSVVSTIAPWEPVESTFKGCEIGCGTRGANSLAVVQPGAAVGQLAYCPVSGVVFRIKESSPRR